MIYIESLFYPNNIGYEKCKTCEKVAMTSSSCTIQKLSVDFSRFRQTFYRWRKHTRVGTLRVATIYLQLIQN